MDIAKKPDTSDSRTKAEHIRPIPNADRRRLVRKQETSDTKAVVITDWASI
jgi:hypothetical protein